MEKGDLCSYRVFATTQIGMEEIAASYLEEQFENLKVLTAPLGFKGIVLVGGTNEDPQILAERVLKATSYIEKAFPIQECVEAEIESIANAAASLAEKYVSSNEKFAVRTVRRGTHSFTSIDVNVRVGAEVQKRTNATVDLEDPDKVVFINILANTAYISLLPGSAFFKKDLKKKPRFQDVFRRMIVAQEPYIGDDNASYNMGARIGRGLQNYEIGEYYVALTKPVPASPLSWFLKGVLEGIESRYSVQVKSYGRKSVKTKVYVYEMHTLVRMFRRHPIVVLEPEGKSVTKVASRLKELLMGSRRPVLLLGSREGVPTGIYRFADLIVDVAPGITLSTEYALPTALGAFEMILGESEG
uniref:RNA-binding protein n=1 Tax=Fervidicoccus fontis TaxID=683846 RepID=A0A7J3ZJL3_9CREN